MFLPVGDSFSTAANSSSIISNDSSATSSFSVYKLSKQIEHNSLSKSGLIIILTFYALLPKSVQFSRAIILFSSITCFLISIFTRSTFDFLKIGLFKNNLKQIQIIALVGSKEEIQRTENLITIGNRTKKKVFKISTSSFSGFNSFTIWLSSVFFGINK